MKKIFIITLVLGIFLLGIVSAGTYANFFYSERCSHCAEVFPFIKDLSNKFEIRFFNVDKGSYDIEGVPNVEIETSDGREITLKGDKEIPKYLKCELQEMTTRECPTYSATEGFNSETNSWFIR